jgi:transcriptional regulator with XRE-family HTH domain
MPTPLVWLQQWRAAHGLTQTEAACLFNVHPVTYAKWEIGTIPLQGAALRLADVLLHPHGMRLISRGLTRKYS